MSHTAQRLESRKEIVSHKKGSEPKEIAEYPRFMVNIGEATTYFELHLGNNGASKAILNAINENRLLCFANLEENLRTLCEENQHLILIAGPFVPSGDGLPTKRYLNRSGKIVEVPPGSMETWMGFRDIPMDNERLPTPNGSRESDHSIIMSIEKAKYEPIKTLQIGLNEAIQKWLNE